MTKTIEQTCVFNTPTLEVKSWRHLVDTPAKTLAFTQRVITILSPEVTKSLPEGWQCLRTIEDTEHWIQERAEESHVLTVQLRSTQEVIGFIFLYEEDPVESLYDLRLGYLLAKEHWGKGFGSELIQGLIHWCHEFKEIRSLVGGVDPENIGSMKVLEKNGFRPVNVETTETIFFEYTFEQNRP